APGHVEIQKLHARSNGTFDAHGSADLRGLELLQLTLTAQASRFAVTVGDRTGRLDGKIGVQAARRDEVLEGHVKVPEATVWLPRISGGRTLQSTKPHPNLKFIDRAGRAASQRAAAERERQNVAGVERVKLDFQAPAISVHSRDVNLEGEAHTQI